MDRVDKKNIENLVDREVYRVDKKNIENLLDGGIYKFDDNLINTRLFRNIIKCEYFDIVEKFLDKIKYLNPAVNAFSSDIILESKIEKYPYLIWMMTVGDKKYKKYYEMEETYRYPLKGTMHRYFKNINDKNLLLIIMKQFFKYQNILSYYIPLDINDKDVEKFLRDVAKKNKNLVKHYISNNILITTDYGALKRYTDIFHNMIDFRWHMDIDVNFL